MIEVSIDFLEFYTFIFDIPVVLRNTRLRILIQKISKLHSKKLRAFAENSIKMKRKLILCWLL